MNPILRDFPDTLDIERLRIRCPLPGDGAVVNAAIRESIGRLRPWLPWATPTPTPDETEALCRRSRARWLERSDLPLFLFRRDTGEFVGGSGLHRIDWNVPKFEIGYWIRTACEGQGLMTEAVAGVTAFAFETLGARRVEIRCDPRNTRSRAIPVRLGFTHEAILRNDARDVDGALRDTEIFARVR
jgi:RimJ/RimL family protein N-acetyltransferase